jgi:hypothetical protein
MKRLGIMQPYLFPYLGYYQLINAVDEFIKGGWINRNNILNQGQKSLFTFPLVGASPNKLINEIEYADEFGKFQKTLAMAYGKAPYKAEVFAFMDKVCNFPDKNLARFNGNALMEVAAYLGMATTFIYSSTLKKDTSLRAQDKVLAICAELGAEQYINAIGGLELYSRDDFKNHGLELKFLRPELPEYNQRQAEFIPGLSIIDIMMFNTPDEIREMLGKYELV